MAKHTAKKEAVSIRSSRLVSRRHPTPVAPRGPDQAWMCDIARTRTADGWMYLAVVLDLYSREIVGGATATDTSELLAAQALSQTLRWHRPAPGSVVFIDQGMLAGSEFQRLLFSNGLVACWLGTTGKPFRRSPIGKFPSIRTVTCWLQGMQ
ncbi:hypothetical protein BJN34_0275 [Cupriavidus necator]|uniref:Integrase catalytic domain-containing protein n=1 Tax=Cupriavidus necator TaxID=106590 RepID=A0A2P1DV39_CUPNE|nr:hypothetical protein BJN34_0275 [Cupriavidus necator]